MHASTSSKYFPVSILPIDHRMLESIVNLSNRRILLLSRDQWPPSRRGRSNLHQKQKCFWCCTCLENDAQVIYRFCLYWRSRHGQEWDYPYWKRRPNGLKTSFLAPRIWSALLTLGNLENYTSSSSSSSSPSWLVWLVISYVAMLPDRINSRYSNTFSEDLHLIPDRLPG